MSRETLQALNTNTLIGFTDRRGSAWHYRAVYQGTESNHYPGPIPVEDVARRLFAWVAESRPLAVERPADLTSMTHLNGDGLPVRWVVVEGRQAIVRSDRSDGKVLGIFGEGYERHQYQTWLLRTVANLLDDDLAISSAGLLKDGAVAWVEVSVPETITTPEGVEFRPNLLATTTFDGSLATTYKRTVTATVCDNTRAIALGEHGQQVRVKHTRNSALKLASAREALAMVHTTAADFAREVELLCATTVTPRQWAQFLDTYVPLTDGRGTPLEGRSLTMATGKREELEHLWRHDVRVAPWAGTAHGVLAAVNTWSHHLQTVRGATRAERNQLRTVTGDFETLDQGVWDTLQHVLTA